MHGKINKIYIYIYIYINVSSKNCELKPQLISSYKLIGRVYPWKLDCKST